MIQTILLTALSSTILFTSSSATITPPKPQVVFTQVLPEENYVSYVVQPQDTLKSIALAYYGSEEAWTTIAKDNPGIADTYTLTAGRLLKIRTKNNQKSQDITPQMAQKEAVLRDQLNEPTAGMSAAPTNTAMPMPTEIPIQAVTPTAPVITQPPSQGPAIVNNTSGISDEAITYLGNCEAGMNPAKNTGNGYYGAFQFSYGTWKSMNTGYDRADLAPIEVQKAAVRQLLQRSSIYNQFPACAVKMHSAGVI